MAAGADLAGMNEAWWGVMADLPGLDVDGDAGRGNLYTLERCLPGSTDCQSDVAAVHERGVRAITASARSSRRGTRSTYGYRTFLQT